MPPDFEKLPTPRNQEFYQEEITDSSEIKDLLKIKENNNQKNNLAPTYVNDSPVTADAYNNEMNFQNNDLGPKGIADVGYVPGVRGNNDFVPGVRGDLMIYMYDSYGDGWNGNELTIGEHTFTIQNG